MARKPMRKKSPQSTRVISSDSFTKRLAYKLNISADNARVLMSDIEDVLREQLIAYHNERVVEVRVTSNIAIRNVRKGQKITSEGKAVVGPAAYRIHTRFTGKMNDINDGVV